MNKRAKSQRTFWCLLPSFTRYSLILLLSGVFLSSVAATRSTSVQIAQKPETTSQEATRAAAERLYEEGLQLYKQRTAESRQQAIEKWKQALPLWQQVDDKKKEATILNNIGKVYSDLSQKQQALNYYNQSLPLWRQVGNKAAQATILSNIGKVYSDLGDNQQALRYYNQSLPLSRQEDDKAQSAITLNNIGKVYSDLGDNQQAVNYYNQSLPLSRQVGNKTGEATTLDNIGSVYSNSGEKQQALNYYNQSLPLSAQVGDKAQSARTLNNIGVVYSDLGDKQQALKYYNQSLPLSKQVGDKAQSAATLSNIGLVYDDLGEKEKALNYYNQSLPLSRQVGNKAGEAATLNNIGGIYDAFGEKQQALKYYNQSLPLSRQVGNKGLEAGTLNNIGKVYSNLGEKQQALKYYNQSLPLSQQVSDKEREAITLYNIAYVERDRGNLQQALTQIQAAIKIIEDLRTKVDSQDLRTSYFASQQDVYKFYIDLLMQLHKQDPSKGYNAEALHASESSRARGLIELLTEARANIRKDVDPKLLQEEKDLQLKIEATGKLLQELSNKPQTETAQENFKKERENLLNQQKELQTKIRTNSPKYAALQYPQPLKLPQIQQQLDKDSLLLEYSLGEERSYLWAVTPNSIDTYELPKREEIEKAVTEFRNDLQKPTVANLTAINATKLSKIILAPVADKLGKKRLVIVADGGLQKIPFAALNDVKTFHRNVSTKDAISNTEVYQPLIVNHEIVNLPSVTTIATQRQELKGRKTAPKILAILADPVFEANDERITGKSSIMNNNLDLRGQIEQSDLKRGAKNLNRNGWERIKGTETEAKAILKLVPSNNLQAFDFDANYNWITNKQLSQYRFLHFATHGFADPNNPELSGIVLSLFLDKQAKPADRGYLRLGDIFNLDFAADLVVLSACETGLGKDVNGEGLVGLTRGLMYAGAERVAVSLWQVNDEGTAQLMPEFYTQMLKQGKSPTVALRAAQIKLWQDSNWQNPYYWSAFTLQGEWR
ncbi:tetratricopeptide repeat protein [Scytonema hofmannii FACHB-248]|uniref:Tetratricopeptide repeat protein n=1 Tax=Scytonema hofmannii FACHB-248 TaxID=1842502 RepID=A0ABR8GVU9_9CYAN|nr:tetratricopeptide repeat protein [Scytonema hofmannii]MBD2607639.1 tetratricopeptide repeat protein [Scytonema hofmannii FACHB-248]